MTFQTLLWFKDCKIKF